MQKIKLARILCRDAVYLNAKKGKICQTVSFVNQQNSLLTHGSSLKSVFISCLFVFTSCFIEKITTFGAYYYTDKGTRLSIIWEKTALSVFLKQKKRTYWILMKRKNYE